MHSLPWSHSPQDILQEYSVSANSGLRPEEVPELQIKFGPNALAVKKKISRWNLFWKQFHDPLIYILMVASLIALFLGEVLDGIAIISIVILNVFVGFFQESKAEDSLEALASLTAPKAKVLRGGVVTEIKSEEIVPGEILVLEAGDYIPADARIIRSHQLSANESVLTGESLPVRKDSSSLSEDVLLSERKNMLFAGTAIESGSARAIVTEIGTRTELGQIAQMMAGAETPMTPMQKRLAIVSERLLWIGMGIITVITLLGILRGESWMKILMSGLSLAIAAVPTGLPTMVTIALVMAVRRMAKKKALVRKMDSVETLGATDVICTDKTGTLTTGKMKVRVTFLYQEGRRKDFFLNMILCNNASVDKGAVGDTTEIALLDFAREEGFQEERIRADCPRLMEWSFDSHRKRMSVLSNVEGEEFVFTKGAPEALLPLCLLDNEERSHVREKVQSFSQRGMRVLGFAMKKKGDESFSELTEEEAESELEFQGLVAIADPPRQESKDAIKKCQSSGIRVIMITGDHPHTAGAIAYELGITKKKDAQVIDGEKLEQVSEEELRKIAETSSVYARVTPAHKLQLVKALKESGHIVAMTGDGVNDAPALKTASIGVSMGRGGTEVARQASSMVLTDDNFATIIDAVEEGRAVYGNIRRALQYLLSTNMAELFFILISLIAGWPVPLLPVNLLWLNLITDGIPALALAAEEVPKEYLQQSQRPSTKSFFDRVFYGEMVFIGLLITLMCLAVYFYGLRYHDLLEARTLGFSFLVYAVLFRSFSCRSETKTFFEMKPNFYHLLSVLIPVVLQVLIQKNELLSRVFKIHEISLEKNLILMGLAAIPVTLVEVYKIFKRRKHHANHPL